MIRCVEVPCPLCGYVLLIPPRYADRMRAAWAYGCVVCRDTRPTLW